MEKMLYPYVQQKMWIQHFSISRFFHYAGFPLETGMQMREFSVFLILGRVE